MSNPTEIVSRWIDAQPEGALIRSLDLEHVVDRNQASRELARLARRGRLMRVARGMYVAVAASHFGPVPPPADKMIQSLACITGRTVVRHGAAAANALGLTTQVPAGSCGKIRTPAGSRWDGTPHQTTIESTRYRRSGKLRSLAYWCEKRGLTGESADIQAGFSA